MFESDCYADDIDSLERVNGVYRTSKDVPIMLWSEYFRKLEKERNPSLRNIFENEYILMKRMYCFLDESQIMGRTLEKLGIPNTCGKINKNFLRQPGKKRELSNHGKYYTKKVLGHKKISIKKPVPKQNLVKIKPPRYAPVVERWSDIALKRQHTENNNKFPPAELYTFRSEENRKTELINKQKCSSDRTPLKDDTNTQPVKQCPNFKIIGSNRNKLVEPTKTNNISQPSLLKMCLNSGSKKITELNNLVPVPSSNTTINLKLDDSLQNRELGNPKKTVRFNDHDLCSFAPSETYESPQTQELDKKEIDKVITDVLTNNLHSTNNSILNKNFGQKTNKEVNNSGKSIKIHTENTKDNPQLFENCSIGKGSNFEIEPYENYNVIIEESSNSSTSCFLKVYTKEENQTCKNNVHDPKQSGLANERKTLTEKTNDEIVSKTVYEQSATNDDQILILNTKEQPVYDNSADNSLNKDITVIEETPSGQDEISEGIEEVKTCGMKLPDQTPNLNRQSPPTNKQTYRLSPPKNINDLTQFNNNDWSDDEYAPCSMTSSPEQVKEHILYSKSLAHIEDQPYTEEVVYNIFKDTTNDNDSYICASLSGREYISDSSDNESNEIIEHSCSTVKPIHEPHEADGLNKHANKLTTPLNNKPTSPEYSYGDDKDSKCTNAPIKASKESVKPSLLHTGEVKMTNRSVTDTNNDSQNKKNIKIRKALFPNHNDIKIAGNENDPCFKENAHYFIATNSFKVLTTPNETTQSITTETNDAHMFELNNNKIKNSVTSEGFTATNIDYISTNNNSDIENELIIGKNYCSERGVIYNNSLRNNTGTAYPISQTSLLSKDEALNNCISPVVENVVQEKEPMRINKVQYRNEAVTLSNCKMNEPNHTGNNGRYSAELHDNSYTPISPEPLHSKNNSDEKIITNHTNNIDKTGGLPNALRNNTAYFISETSLLSKDAVLNSYISLKNVVQVNKPIQINEVHCHNEANINETNDTINNGNYGADINSYTPISLDTQNPKYNSDEKHNANNTNNNFNEPIRTNEANINETSDTSNNGNYGADIYNNSYTAISLDSLHPNHNSDEKNIANHATNTLNNVDKTVEPNALRNNKAYTIIETNLNSKDAVLTNYISLKNVVEVIEPIQINEVHCHNEANINETSDTSNNGNYGADLYNNSYTAISLDSLHPKHNSDETNIANHATNTLNNVDKTVVPNALKNNKVYPISETNFNGKDAVLTNYSSLKNVVQVKEPIQINEVHCHNEANINETNDTINNGNYGADINSYTPISLDPLNPKNNSDEKIIENHATNNLNNVDKTVAPNALRNNKACPVSETNLNSKDAVLTNYISLKNVVEVNEPIQINEIHCHNEANINETNDTINNGNYGADINSYTPISLNPLDPKNNSDEKIIENHAINTLNNVDKTVAPNALRNNKACPVSETNFNRKDRALNNCILLKNVVQVKEPIQINEVPCHNEANILPSSKIKEPNDTSNYGAADLHNDLYTPLSLELSPPKSNSDDQIIKNLTNNIDKTVALVDYVNNDLLTEQPEILIYNTVPDKQEGGSIIVKNNSQPSPVNKSNMYNISTEKKECSYSHVLTTNTIKIYNTVKEKRSKKEVSPVISDLNYSEEKITSQTFKQNIHEIKNSNLVTDLFLFEQKQQTKQPAENLEHCQIIREKEQCRKEPLSQSMLVPQAEIRETNITIDCKVSNAPKNIDVSINKHKDNFTTRTIYDNQRNLGQSKISCSNPVDNLTTASKLRFANSSVISKNYQLLKQSKTSKAIRKTSPIKITNVHHSFSKLNYKISPEVDPKTSYTNQERKTKSNIFLCTDTQFKVKSQTETLVGEFGKNKQKNTDLKSETGTDPFSGLKTQRMVPNPNERTTKQGLVKCKAQTEAISAYGKKNSISSSRTQHLANQYCTTAKVFPVVGEKKSNKTRTIKDKENITAHRKIASYVSTSPISKNIVADIRPFKENNGDYHLYYKSQTNETQTEDKPQSSSKSFVTNNKQNSMESSTKSVNKIITGYKNLEEMPFGNMSDDDYSLSSFSLSEDSIDFKTNSSPKGNLSPYNSPVFGNISFKDLPELSKYKIKRKNTFAELDGLSDFDSPNKLMKKQHSLNKQPNLPVNRKGNSLDCSAFQTNRNQMSPNNNNNEKQMKIDNLYSENTNSFRTETTSSPMSDEYNVLNSPSSDKEKPVLNNTYLTEMFDEESSSSFRSWLSTGISVSEDY